jgi:hypothetical protein
MLERNDSDGVISRLQEQIQDLMKEQSEALKTAMFVGMTPDDARTYDARRTLIGDLIQQLADVAKAQ